MNVREAIALKLDLSKSRCHICGWRLLRDLEEEKERCVNPGCQVCGFLFSIPYVQVKENIEEEK